MIVRTAFDVPDSPARVGDGTPGRAPFRVGLVQERYHDDTAAQELGYLRMQPTSDDRILRGLGAA